MRNKIITSGAGMALCLFACLGAPEEPSQTATSALHCPPNEQVFNGSCRAPCATSTDCASGLSCMNVGGAASLCLDYAHCAHLESDTECETVSGGNGSYETDWEPGETDYGYGYGYGSASCVGNARWVATSPGGDPSCGQPHAVSRCRPIAGGCALVTGSTRDVADP